MPGGFPYRPYRIINKIGATCPVGYKDFYKMIGMRGHNGQDNATWHLEPVYHCGLFNGWMQTGHDQDGGLNVMVVSNEPLVECAENCPKGTMHYIMLIYAHGGKAVGFEKKSIKPGDNIMLADNTGDSSGDHCHWAPKWCNEKGVGLHLDNGYNGAFAPDPFYKNIFILDHLKEQVVNPPPIPNPVIPLVPPQPVTLNTQQWLYKAIFEILLLLRNLSPLK